MDKVRRKHALEHKYELLNKALKSEKHARKGEFIDFDSHDFRHVLCF